MATRMWNTGTTAVRLEMHQFKMIIETTPSTQPCSHELKTKRMKDPRLRHRFIGQGWHNLPRCHSSLPIKPTLQTSQSLPTVASCLHQEDLYHLTHLIHNLVGSFQTKFHKRTAPCQQVW